MKNLFLTLIITLVSLTAFSQEKLSTTSGHIKFFSSTAAENIEANNYKVTSIIKPTEGILVFSVPMQSFEFEKALMQKHYNSSKFLNTKKFPKGKFKGKISNLSDVDFSKDGTYEANVTGILTIHGVAKEVKEKFNFIVKDGKVTGLTEFNVVLADYNVVFSKGKPSQNIAKTIKITANLNYSL